MFSIHTASEEFENVTVTGQFGFVLEEIRSGKSRDKRDVIVSDKLPFQNNLCLQWNAKPTFFKFLRFKKRFPIALFSWRISVDGRPKSNNAACVFTFLRRHVYEATVVWRKLVVKLSKRMPKLKRNMSEVCKSALKYTRRHFLIHLAHIDRGF